MISKENAKIMFYTLTFYIISITLGFFSSYLLSQKNYNFRFPLFVTAVQNCIHFVLANCYIFFIAKKKMRKKTIDEPLKDTNFDTLLDLDNETFSQDLQENRLLDVKPYKANNEEANYIDTNSNSSSKNALSDIPITIVNEENKDKLDQTDTKNMIVENNNTTSLFKGEKMTIENKQDKRLARAENNGLVANNDKNYNTDTNIYHPTVDGNLTNNTPAKSLSYADATIACKLAEEHTKINYNDIPNNPIKTNQKTVRENNQQKELISGKSLIDIYPYFLTTLPCALTAAVDIGVSSHSLRTVTLAFYTMIKSSAPIFVLLSGFMFGIEKPSIKLFLIVFLIGAGVFLTTIKTDSVTKTITICFSKTTFSLLFASFMAGFRWAFIQYLIQKGQVKKKDVIYTIKDLCLPISILLFLFSCYFEGLSNIFASEFFFDRQKVARSIFFIVLSGLMSFLLLLSEFLLVSKTSVVYLSISGIFKELTVVFISVCRKEIDFRLINFGGLAVSIFGMLLYNMMRYEKSKDREVPSQNTAIQNKIEK